MLLWQSLEIAKGETMRFGIYVKKSINGVFWWIDKINKPLFRKTYLKYLKWLGVNIDAADYKNTGISPTIFLDSTDYSKITIGKNVTISFDVVVLVHDYSIINAARAVDRLNETDGSIIKPVVIGNNVFVGAKVVLLPGTTIGDNCIIGAGAVVKGKLKENSVYAGNPCRYICSTEEYVNKHLRHQENIVERKHGL